MNDPANNLPNVSSISNYHMPTLETHTTDLIPESEPVHKHEEPPAQEKIPKLMVHCSERHMQSCRYLGSKEYGERKCSALSRGEAWTTESLGDETPLALIV